MATYTVQVVTVFRTPCTHGRHHIREVHISPLEGRFGVVQPDRLLVMQMRDSFVAPNPDSVHEDVPVAFEPCDCGGGYVVVPAGVVEEIPGYI